MAMAMATAGFGRTASNGAYLSDPLTWGSWSHRGHRLWASMSDAFWVYVFKVDRCPQPSSHDWTSCPYAHKGERARRRDPRRFSYLPVPCPDYRASHQQCVLTGSSAAPTCVRGLRCRYAHGVFELWLHPGRFRTRMCEAGARCPRPICFFAHCAAERRSEDDAVPLVGMPPPPLPRVPRAPAPTAPVSFPRHVDLIVQAMPGKLRLYGGAAGTSSTAAAAVGTAPAVASPDDEDSVGKSSRCADEEDTVINDYPHFDLIMDMVMS